MHIPQSRAPRIKPDVNQFRQTLRPATTRVHIQHLLADAGYDSEPNRGYAREAHGIRTTIPAKHRRPMGKPPSGRYRRLMATRFNKVAYGQRRQAEMVMFMIKRNLGSALSARTYWSRCREMSLKVLTHNIVILLSTTSFSTKPPFRLRIAPGT